MEKAVSAIRALKGSVLVLTHHNADIDAIGSALALSMCLRERGLSVHVGVSESISRSARKMAQGTKVIVDPDCSKYDTVIVVDTSVPEQLASVRNLRADILIDHHEPGPIARKAGAKWINKDARSTAQMIYHIACKLKCKVTRKMAALLAAGIVADTAHLRIAEKEEFRALLSLLETGIRLEDVMKLIETPIDVSERIAGLKAAARATIFKVDDLLVAFSKLKSHEATACRALIRTGADIAVVAAVKKSEIRISSRAKKSIEAYKIDLAEIFKEVGEIIGGTGGGHAQAGSANGKKPGEVHKAFDFVLRQVEARTRKKARKVE